MSLFMVDAEKCNRDGICVETCPCAIIALHDDDPVPRSIKDAKEICINCGHCVAVCPTGALSLSTMKLEDCPPIQRGQLPSPEQIEHFLRSRRSIRTYTGQAVDRELLTHLLHVAGYAPTGHNSQPVEWQIIYDLNEVQRLAGLVADWMRHLMHERPSFAATLHLDRMVASWDAGIDRICRSAPHVIVAHAPKDHLAAPSSCTIALTYLELAAYACGLGACWGGFLHVAANRWLPLQKALELPDGHVCLGAMMIGYPKYRYQRIPLRNSAKITWR